jgi:hypothetical protein
MGYLVSFKKSEFWCTAFGSRCTFACLHLALSFLNVCLGLKLIYVNISWRLGENISRKESYLVNSFLENFLQINFKQKLGTNRKPSCRLGNTNSASCPAWLTTLDMNISFRFFLFLKSSLILSNNLNNFFTL